MFVKVDFYALKLIFKYILTLFYNQPKKVVATSGKLRVNVPTKLSVH